MTVDDIEDRVLLVLVLWVLWLELPTILRLWNRRKLLWRSLRDEWRRRD